MSKFNPYSHLNVTRNPDGTLTRLDSPTIESHPNPLPGQAVVSKDVTINTQTRTWVRLYRPTRLPSNDNAVARLPIVIYFHHGGWILLSAADIAAHRNCSQIASEIPAIVVSVNYRLAPESRLPEQYHDGSDAVYWVDCQASGPEGEPWLKDYGDFSRCYLYGCGCGGNIVFFVGLRVKEMELQRLKMAGIVMNQPMFGGVERTESELNFATDQLLPLPVLDLMWDLVLPKGVDRDHWYCNPMADDGQKELIKRLGRCLVIGFGGDPMVDRQNQLVTLLVTCGVQVDAHFDDVGFHNVDFVDRRRAAAVFSIVKGFIF
ncbi:hypothetical protein CsatB_011932 [Cannabis sativa]